MVKTLQNKKGTFIEISAVPAEGWVYARWIGQLEVEDVKNGALAVLEVLEESGLKILLNDNRDLLGHWNQANDWIAEVWMPRALALGLRKFAHILSHYSFGQLSAQQMKVRVGNSFEMQLFKDMDKAKEWLIKPNS